MQICSEWECRRANRVVASGGVVSILATLLVAASLPRAHAEEDDASRQLRAAMDEAVEALADVGRHCHRSKLYKERDEVARELLDLDPDHEVARKWLKFRRGADGTWKRSGDYREPRNLGSRGALKALPAVRARKLAGPVDRLWQLVQRYDDVASNAVRIQALQLLVRLRPDDVRFREANGECRHGGRWVLKETAAARRRRPELTALVARARGSVPTPRRASQTTIEKRLPFTWQACVTTREIRVLGTCGAAEVMDVARTVHAARVLLRSLLGVELPAEPDLTVWLLADRAEHELLVKVLPPEVGPKEQLLDCAGFWIPVGPTVVDSSGAEAGRKDGAVRQLIDHDLVRALPGLTQNEPLKEGLGIYLTHLITGTRLSVMSKFTDYAKKADAGDRDEDLLQADWLRLALRMGQRGELPTLRGVLGTPLNALELADLVCASVFARYRLEGRPEEVVAVLRQTERGGVVNDAAVEVLGLDVLGLDGRVRRWIAEMTGA